MLRGQRRPPDFTSDMTLIVAVSVDSSNTQYTRFAFPVGGDYCRGIR